MLILDLVAFVIIAIFTVFIAKLWLLVKHKALAYFIFAGIIALVLRGMLILVDIKILTVPQTNIYRTVLSNVVQLFWVIGAIALYYEVKKLVGKKE